VSPRVRLELSSAHVGKAAPAANGSARQPVVLRRDLQEALAVADARLQYPRILQTKILGFLVMACFPADGGDLSNSEIAGRLDLPLTSIHSCLSRLVDLGVLERDPATRRYRHVN
jgi:IclR helix-turn-helix domain